jgi:hypothetical protein
MQRRLSQVAARALTVALAITGCSSGGDSPETVDRVDDLEVHVGTALDAAGEGTLSVTLDPPGAAHIAIHLDGQARIVEIDVAGAVSATLGGTSGAAYGHGTTSGVWLRPAPFADGVLDLDVGEGASQVTIAVRGAPLPEAREERSLVWTDPALLDDPSAIGTARVLGAAAEDGHGGLLLERWFRRFATTLHSERAGPAQLIDEIAALQGSDPEAWDLDALPFKVTGIHNRIDLAHASGGCGELRVSLASTHAVYAPLHLLFLFRQEPAADDIGPDGAIHCLGSARRWSRLSALDGVAFIDAARAWLGDKLIHERFLLAESVELTVSPWEWRQWLPMGGDELDNPPLFQTVATGLLNQPSALRDSFLAFVEKNAAALAAREVELPAAFRQPSARLPPSVPAEPLDLSGIPPGILQAYPALGTAIEIVGCPRCHTEDANFVHTAADRTFSPFYQRELEARAERLDAMGRGSLVPLPPFGPLQALGPR